MIWIYLLLVAFGVALAVAHARRHSPYGWLAAAGTALAALALLGGFSVGPSVAPVALLVLAAAALPLGRRDRVV